MKLLSKITLILALVLLSVKSDPSNKFTTDDPYAMYQIKGVTLKEGLSASGITLLTPLSANLLYETWIISVYDTQEKSAHVKIAHIFKYGIENTFPMKINDLVQWCKKIVNTNAELEHNNIQMRAMPCDSNSIKTVTIAGNNVTYIGFDMPLMSTSLQEACDGYNMRERICKYSIKSLAKALIFLVQKNLKYSKMIDDFYLLKKNLYFKGRMESKTNGKTPMFFVIPFLAANTPEQILGLKPLIPAEEESQKKAYMNHIAYMLYSLYKNIPADEEDIEAKKLMPLKELHLKDLFQLYNKKYLDNKISINDPYTNLSEEQFKVCASKMDSATLDEQEMILKNTMYEFLNKLSKSDDKQFKSFQEVSAHPFMTNKFSNNLIQSNTAEDSPIEKIKQKREKRESLGGSLGTLKDNQFSANGIQLK